MARWTPHVLRDYALVADGERGALVGPDGAITWLCFPSWDSPAVLAGLVGGGGGYQVCPEQPYVWGGHYEPGGLVWRNRWTSVQGQVECRDAMGLPGRSDQAVLLRQVTAVRGAATVRVRLSLRTDFGAHGPREVRRDEQGCWRGRLGEGSFCWTGAGTAVVVQDGGHADLVLEQRLDSGQSMDLVLTLSTAATAPEVDAQTAWAEVQDGWRRRLPALSQLGHAARDVQHAHAVLHGLTSSSGGMVAAATLGLPERAEAGRNYDYRYAWVRDQCIVGQSVAATSDPTLLHTAVRFVTARVLEHGPDLAPAYRVHGGPVPDEDRLDLPGYPGGADVVGNWVNGQFQLDAFGEVLLLLAAGERHGGLDSDAWSALQTVVDAVHRRWREPDAGIWELEPQRWTHSRLQCAAGLRAVSRLPRAGAQGSD